MSISGNLETMELAELCQWLSQVGKTGTLVINNGRVEKRIFFQEGAIIATASSDPKEYLGHFLVSHGLIDEVVLAKAMDMQDANKMMLGKILVTINAISEQDVERMLKLKSEETIYEVFTWPQGEFRFLDEQLPAFRMHPISLNVTAVVLEGVKRVDDWERIRQSISSAQVVPVIVGELEPPDNDPLAQQILSLIDDDRTIEDIALHSHASEYQVCRALFDQIEKKRVKAVRPRILGSLPTDTPVKDAVDPDGLLQIAAGHLAREEFELALRHLRAAQSLDPDNKRIRAHIKKAEKTITRSLDEAGVQLDAVPYLERSFQDLTSLDITPQEGFILTRINDTYDIRTIMKISPLPALDARLVFWRLLAAGHISLVRPDRDA